jgi:hypothetical protein
MKGVKTQKSSALFVTLKGCFTSIVALLVFCLPVQCQSEDGSKIEIGLNIGYGLTSIHSGNATKDPEITSYFGLGGINIDAYATYYFTYNVGASIGLGFSSYNQYSQSKKNGITSMYEYYDMDGDIFIPTYDLNYDVYQNVNYFNIPIGASLRFGKKKIQFYSRFGALLGFFMSGSEVSKGSIYYYGTYPYLPPYPFYYDHPDYGFGMFNVSETYSYTGKDIESFNFSLFFEAGAKFKIYKKFSIGIGGYLNTGFTDISVRRDKYILWSEAEYAHEPITTSAYGGQLKLIFDF